tara:strand:- start:928 stop:1479 length:552 start_codon:yes stop_codon:yes gene_type:complete
MSDSIYDINHRLIEKYGRDIATNEPRFRVVWTSTQLEKRYGEFEVFSEGGIFLREEKGVREEPKYLPEYPDMWVLEQLVETAGNPYLEMVVKWSYEPLWIFGAANSDRTPIWRAVDLLVRNRLHGDPNLVHLSPSDLIRAEEAKMAKEKQNIKDMLSDETTDISFALKHGTAVTVGGNNGKDV